MNRSSENCGTTSGIPLIYNSGEERREVEK